ncbi:MAG TPA: DUF4286 family protein [Steroidobacteraceae bacterium]|nr:DUF4286 family protein [Steroidobacteraceae bacterium]
MSDALPSPSGVTYEVELEADAAIEKNFDTWLRDHVADVLQFDGFLSAEILTADADSPDHVRRIVRYRLRDRAALDDYLRDHAARMDAQGVERFGGRISTEQRTLASREEFIRGQFSTENCLNCGEVLTGQHCSHCGQRARVRVLSLWGLLKDLFGDLFEWDSRVWRTLRPLAFRPGLLTAEFLRGRRMHYTPPFRMYLILSVGFFLLANLGTDPGAGMRVNVDEKGDANLNLQLGTRDDEAEPGAEATNAAKPAAEAANAAEPAAAAPTPELDAELVAVIDAIVKRMPEAEQQNARKEFMAKLGSLTPEQLEPVKKTLTDPCSEDSLTLELSPGLQRYEPRLREACRKIVADSPTFGRAMFENIPKMMFIFLPLIAAVMYVLYIGSGRYYVEHLLFVVHFHAFFFLGGLAVLLLQLLQRTAGETALGKGLSVAEGVLIAAFVIYLPIYLYRAMRRVYGQGPVVTSAKYAVLGIAYVFCLSLTAVGLLLYTALTL